MEVDASCINLFFILRLFFYLYLCTVFAFPKQKLIQYVQFFANFLANNKKKCYFCIQIYILHHLYTYS